MISKVKFKHVLIIWWRFFWRYAVLFVLLSLLGGFLLNFIGTHVKSQILFCILVYSLMSNFTISTVVLLYVLNRNFSNSDIIFSSCEKSKFLICVMYFMRFMIFSLLIAVSIGFIYPILVNLIGLSPFEYLKYAKYIGNISSIPASFITFLIMAWRKKEKKRIFIIKYKTNNL